MPTWKDLIQEHLGFFFLVTTLEFMEGGLMVALKVIVLWSLAWSLVAWHGLRI